MSRNGIDYKILCIKETLTRLTMNSKEDAFESPFQSIVEKNSSKTQSPLCLSEESLPLNTQSFTLKKTREGLEFGNFPLNSPQFPHENQGDKDNLLLFSGRSLGQGEEKVRNLNTQLVEQNQMIENLTFQLENSLRDRENKDREIHWLNRELQEMKIAGNRHEILINKIESELEELRHKNTRISQEEIEPLRNLLETQNNKFLTEKSQLQGQIKRISFDLQTLQGKYTLKTEEINKIKQSNANYQQELLEHKREKVELLKSINELTSKLNHSVSGLTLIQEKNTELKQLLSTQGRDTPLYPHDYTLEREIEKLKSENTQLKRLTTLKKRTYSVPNARARTKSPCTPQSKQSHSPKFLINSVKRELAVASNTEILPKLKCLLKESAQQQNFISKIIQLRVDCSPPRTVTNKTTLQQLCKWVKGLLKEYFLLKKQLDPLSSLTEAFSLNSIIALPQTVTAILRENEEFLLLLNKVKTRLSLPHTASLQDINIALSQ